MSYDVPTEDPHERLEPYDDPECDVAELRWQISQLRAQLALLQAERDADKCKQCSKPLPIRAFCAVVYEDGRTFCSVKCWLDDCKDRAREVF